MASNEQLIKNTVSKRSRAFVDSLYLNEQLLVLFVDSPQLQYPLSARRLERYHDDHPRLPSQVILTGGTRFRI